MLIYPTIEIQDGRCVSLDKGRLDEPLIWHVDPVGMAQSFAKAGAEWMHLTDVDGITGNARNAELVETIIRKAGIPVQLGGGFRSRDGVERWIDKGAGRIVIGTLAAQEPDIVKQLAKYHPDQIVLALDVWNGHVMIDGWRRQSAITPEDFIAEFEDVPLAAIIITDIDSDIDAVDGRLGVISGLAAHSRTPVIASGVVRTVDDIARLKYIPNISGALVGRALFRKTVELGAALLEARRGPEKVAEFI
ncbi:1-(5-phosphoribosyl)-5-[(5-phosphoribosylamino)methylideneamino]imidazole-4-carboxamide isomerase [Albibacillus kandeliae]|uniref:1-(5-phosphoribosyl)-5-[(5- phosphoribosylamino)methylideneamino]imidazole-4- carboxamide isomerase n=1 Tax=Albibacillus kandeliae TaxID=2174228 RepID=UPI000D689A32|nr:1-(5-phosphoribosyl)-5-[(5-phosphoribosylamino)methylideneamino] imidazole-4-carboxamide isomerase [Albibacillus kandeliae]